MTAYLIITSEVEDANVQGFGDWLTKSDHPWWHWLDGAWIIIEENETQDRYYWRDAAKVSLGVRWLLVLELPPGLAMAGFLPQEAIDWLAQYWDTTTKKQPD